MITYEIIKNTYLRIARSHIGEKETRGKNRSPIIDLLCKRGGVDLGSPYCLLGATACLDDACKELGLKNPVGVKAGTQSFFSKTPKAYQRNSAKQGMIGIFQNRSDRAHGHAVICTEDEDSDFEFSTIEYNTDPSGGRDGDGVYKRVRHAKGDSRLCLRGFVDVIQWVCDANGVQS